MRALRNAGLITTLILTLSACSGSSGGGNNANPGEAACPGANCGRDDELPAAPLACGGIAGATCPDGYRCVDDTADNCDPATGADCGGTCLLGEDDPGPECGGFGGGSCPDGYACVDDPDDDCDGGPAVDCPGICAPDAMDECDEDADCPQLDARCAVCTDGSVSCPSTSCTDGKCIIDMGACVPLVCEGFAGLVCPAGFQCIDDPADNCDPRDGGADCGGICIQVVQPPTCGGFGGGSCPDGYACVDDPNDECDGGPAVDCPGICAPDAMDECDDDAECPQLDARCAVCADGSVSCPSTSCTDGKCIIDMGACVPLVCEGFAGLVCPAGFQCIDDPADNCDPRDGGADCGGICIPVVQPPTCGGGEACPPGTKCVDDPLAGCWPNAAGDDCGPSCMPVSTEECTDDSDCPALRAPCSECRDGSAACPQSFCDHGRCNVSFPTCPPPVVCGPDGEACKPGHACVDDPNDACDPANGEVRCSGVCVDQNQPRACGGFAGETCPRGYVCADDPGDDCQADTGADCPGICQPDDSPECRADSECPTVLAPCVECPGGSFACPIGLCRDGKCDAAMASCPDPGFCGGIAGFPCPDGFTCIDAPNDECDPQNGGADCGGICVREEKPRPCAGFIGESCPEGYDCVDDTDDCDPDAGGADCPGHCVPAPPPPCSSDAECPQIGAPCRLCPDGTAACPSSFCANGQCQVSFEGCEVPS